MKRRYFIQAAVSSVIIPHALAHADPWANPWANPRANAQISAAAPQWEWGNADWFFYDGRFPLARQLAMELSGSTGLTPVQGDITDIWNAGLGRTCGQSRLTLHGVTTESFHFCLKIMAGELSSVETRVSRIDRDLFLWQIRCGQTIKQDVLA
jgi:hypothetical protein